MLKRIRIKGYKSFQDLDLKLGEFCVLFGPNAAGKSNFLDALQLLGRVVNSRNLNEAFEPPYRGNPLESFSFPQTGLKGLLEKDSARFSMEIDVELSTGVIEQIDRYIRKLRQTKMVKEEPGSYLKNGKSDYIRERLLRYRIEIEILPKSGILRVVDEYLAALTIKGTPKAGRAPFLEKVKDKIHLRMEGQAHPTYYDLYLDHSVLSRPLYAPHYPHVTAFKEELSNWHFFYFEPRERMRMVNPVKEVRHIGLMGEELAAFLNTLRAVNEKQLWGIEKALHAIIPSVTGIDVSVNEIGEVELRIMEGKTPIPARIVSEGTLRILGLLALGATKDPFSLVGFEEPENGVHPRRIRLIAELLKSRAQQGDAQLIVTTHSPILPDMLSNDNLYVCRKLEGKTEIQPFAVWGPLARRSGIDNALEEEEEKGAHSISTRILRGDFDA